jgi:hypothetical protein
MTTGFLFIHDASPTNPQRRADGACGRQPRAISADAAMSDRRPAVNEGDDIARARRWLSMSDANAAAPDEKSALLTDTDFELIQINRR